LVGVSAVAGTMTMRPVFWSISMRSTATFSDRMARIEHDIPMMTKILLEVLIDWLE
jgi:hypothetical protein